MACGIVPGLHLRKTLKSDPQALAMATGRCAQAGIWEGWGKAFPGCWGLKDVHVPQVRTPPPAMQGTGGGEGGAGETEGRKCFSSSIGNNNTGGPGCAGKGSSAWGLEKVPLQEVLKWRAGKCWRQIGGKTQEGPGTQLGLCPSSPSSPVSLSGDRKGQRGGAMCLKMHSLLSVSTQLLGTVSSALHPGVHTPKLQPQP